MRWMWTSPSDNGRVLQQDNDVINGVNMDICAEYYDGKSARAHPVLCRFFGEMLEVRTPEGKRLTAWPLDGIVADSPHALPLRLRYERGHKRWRERSHERLVLRDADAAAPVRQTLAPYFAKRKRLRHMRLFMGVAAVWLAVACLWFAFPFIVNGVTAMIPHSWEQAMGKESRDMVGRIISKRHSGKVPWLDSGPAREAVEELVSRLAGNGTGTGPGPDAEDTFRVSILDARLVNAFALPGGYIVVTTGLIRQCRTPDELAGVLAHEMAHVTERHNIRQMVRDRFFAFVAALLTGGSDIMDLVHSAGSAVVNSRFSREDEREADILGVRRLAKAGIDPEAIAKFFSGVSSSPGTTPEDTDGFSYLDSHPLLAERITYMREEAAGFPGPFAPALSQSRWRTLQTLAGKVPSYGI